MTVEITTSERLAAYLASPELSTHLLSAWADGGPRYYQLRRQGTAGEQPTDAQSFGSLFEDLAQGRMPTLDHLVVQPADLNKGEGARARAAAWRAANAHRQVVTQQELDDLQWMHESLLESTRVLDLVRQCAPQVTMRDTDAGLKSRPDWARIDAVGSYSIDLKTCQSVAQISYGQSVRKYRYHVQAALVRHLTRSAGYADSEHYLLACEKRSPYRVQLVRVTPAWLDAGWAWAQTQIASIRACEARGEWPRVLSDEVDLPALPACMEVEYETGAN